MRVLVEQVAAEIQAGLERLGGCYANIGIHPLIGGVEAGEWHLTPEREAILVGTQDMLLSRAMNRGYGTPRARWPMDFGLLNQDCLWVMDEVQLMDVGLATSAQLQAFREQDEAQAKSMRPCKTWWMSATLQKSWVLASPDTLEPFRTLPQTRIPVSQRIGPLWDEDKVRKPLRIEPIESGRKLASLVAEAHVKTGRGALGPTLVVVNRVEWAFQVYDALVDAAKKSLSGTELRLIHSRFRRAERAGWREAFLNRGACSAGTDRIIVATQVVEAGVDISAAVLVTELAPWPSLVQRFGRCARWGGKAEVIVADNQATDDKAAAPYARDQLDAARDALTLLTDVAPRQLEAFEEAHPELLPRLYPYEPAHLLMRNELDELFDTTADLSGADIDISRFIRSGEERDLQVFWQIVDKGAKPASTLRASRDALCAVPFLRAREWLCGKGQRLTAGVRAWIWDWLDGEWTLAKRRQLYPGQTLLVAADMGGYDPLRGWDGSSKSEVVPVTPTLSADIAAADAADNTEDDESLSATRGWQTIAFHGEQVGRQAAALASALAPALRDLLDLAGRWHDVGKVHPAFQGCLRTHSHGQQIAKAPPDQWLRGRQLYRMPEGTQRHGYRHELASTLALLALLRRCAPDHPAMLGPWRELLAQTRCANALPLRPGPEDEIRLTPIEREVLALDANQFDLLLYLVCSHHGKVRMSWHASPADQLAHDTVLRIRGIRAGDLLPALMLADAQGIRHNVLESELVLAPSAVGLNPYTGRGWTERVLGLLQYYGPFTLAWLEAVLRAADQRATRDLALVDPVLHADSGDDGLEGRGSSAAGAAEGEETAPSLLPSCEASRQRFVQGARL